MNAKTNSKLQLLLLEDVVNLGRKGDLVSAKPGFVRNFLLPKKRAVLADKRTIRMRERLVEERANQANRDKKDAEELAKKLKTMTLSMVTKTDTQGHLYGSVTALDVVKLLSNEGVEVDKKSVKLPKQIKFVGLFDIALTLKEGVSATFKLKVEGDRVVAQEQQHLQVVEEGEKRAVDELHEGEGERSQE